MLVRHGEKAGVDLLKTVVQYKTVWMLLVQIAEIFRVGADKRLLYIVVAKTGSFRVDLHILVCLIHSLKSAGMGKSVVRDHHRRDISHVYSEPPGIEHDLVGSPGIYQILYPGILYVQRYPVFDSELLGRACILYKCNYSHSYLSVIPLSFFLLCSPVC